METHIVHKFEEADLYDKQLKVWNHIYIIGVIKHYLIDQACIA